MIRGDRIRELLEAEFPSQAALARAVGVSPQAISKLILGETTDTNKIYQLARALKTSPEYLTGETDNPRPGANDDRVPWKGPTPEPDSDDVEIDSIDLAYGMGATFLDIHESDIEKERIRFSRRWLRKFTHSAPRLLFSTEGQGDSMMPTIHDRDVVVIDRGAKEPADVIGERIWAIVFAGMGSLKRLRPLPDGTVRIMSDNPAIRDEIASDGDLHVIGRVVAIVKRA